MSLLGQRTVTRRRYDGSAWVAGRWVQSAPVDTAFAASVQRLTGRDRQVLPEGHRIRADRKVITERLGFVRSDAQDLAIEADELLIDGETYVVTHRDISHSLIPHEVIFAVRTRERSSLTPQGVLTDIENGLRSWLVAHSVDGGLLSPDDQVIFAHETGPRPPLPYLAVDVTMLDERIGYDSQRTNNLGEVEVRGLRQGTCSVLAYGEGSVAWLERATTLLTSPAADALLDAAGLDVETVGGLVDLTALTDTSEEGRHQRDFRFLYVREPRTGEAEQGTILQEAQHTDTWDSDPNDLVVSDTIDMNSP